MKKSELRSIIRESIKQILSEKSEMCSCTETINGQVTKFKCKRKASDGEGCGCCRRFKKWQEGPNGPDMANPNGGPTGELTSGERMSEGGGCSGGQITEAETMKNTCRTNNSGNGCKGGCDGSCSHNHWINVGGGSDEFKWCSCEGGGKIAITPTNDDEKFLKKL
jgi:hypothetical protein